MEIVDAMDRMSRGVISRKMWALEKEDEVAKMQVEGGQDIMSVLCTSLNIFFLLLLAHNPLWLVKADMLTEPKDHIPDSKLTGQMSYILIDFFF